MFGGNGMYTYSDGSLYSGMYKESKRNGLGRFIYSDGDVFEGEWIDDVRNGPGTLTKITTGEIIHGIWKNDRLEIDEIS